MPSDLTILSQIVLLTSMIGLQGGEKLEDMGYKIHLRL